MPIDFSFLSSKKSQINGISEKVDKRSSGYKRRKEALQTAPEQIPSMIERALYAGSFLCVDGFMVYTAATYLRDYRTRFRCNRYGEKA